MIKSELIARLANENPHLTQKDVERVVSVILERMIGALEDGGRVELRGFGALSVRSRPARTGRNPRTGEAVEVRVDVCGGAVYVARVNFVASRGCCSRRCRP